MEKISFFDQDSNESIELFVLEQTKLNGNTYLLCTEEEEGDGVAYILQQISMEEEEELLYKIVEDDNVLQALSKVFEELLEDVDIS